MEKEQIKFCECGEQEFDINSHNFIFYLCKSCGDAIRRKEDICTYFLMNGYCQLAEERNYTYRCKIEGDFTKCSSGKAEVKENDSD